MLPLEIAKAKSLAEVFSLLLKETKGDAGLAVLSLKMQVKLHNRFSYFPPGHSAPGQGYLQCLACQNRLLYFASWDWPEIAEHLSLCSEWEKLDRDASRLLHTTFGELEIAIDNAHELGIL